MSTNCALCGISGEQIATISLATRSLDTQLLNHLSQVFDENLVTNTFLDNFPFCSSCFRLYNLAFSHLVILDEKKLKLVVEQLKERRFVESGLLTLEQKDESQHFEAETTEVFGDRGADSEFYSLLPDLSYSSNKRIYTPIIQKSNPIVPHNPNANVQRNRKNTQSTKTYSDLPQSHSKFQTSQSVHGFISPKNRKLRMNRKLKRELKKNTKSN